jgi:2-polyprenyl-6-methoxyphenol hydroxylase-like FAD-dependent oxidoreductase
MAPSPDPPFSAPPRVVVVGAGPCGSALALQLLRGGVAVDLVEGRCPHQHLPRGEGLMPSGLEALDRLGLIHALPEGSRRPLRSWAFWLEGQPLFSVAEPLGAGPPCSLIRTPWLLETLLEEARAWPGLRWHPGRTATALHWEGPPADAAGDGTRVRGVQLDDGRLLEADLVVACDGRNSRLRQLADLGLQEDPQAVAVLWFALEAGPATAPLERWLDGRFVTLLAGGESLAFYSPAGGGLRLGWLSEGDRDAIPAGTNHRPGQEIAAAAGAGQAPAAASPTPSASAAAQDPAASPNPAASTGGPDSASCAATVRSLPWAERFARLSPDDLAPLWRALEPSAIPAPVPVRIRPALASRWHRPGLLLLGDAAHPMSPLRAQGLNMALRDAVVAAETLLELLRPEPWRAAGSDPQRRARLENALATVERHRRPEILRIQALQRQELGRALLLRRNGLLRRLLTATAPWSGALLARRWQAGQPTLRRGLPLS